MAQTRLSSDSAQTITPNLYQYFTMDPKLLELLVCPVTKGPLQYHAQQQELISLSAKLAYPIRDGIPILLEVQARTLSDEECERK